MQINVIKHECMIDIKSHNSLEVTTYIYFICTKCPLKLDPLDQHLFWGFWNVAAGWNPAD